MYLVRGARVLAAETLGLAMLAAGGAGPVRAGRREPDVGHERVLVGGAISTRAASMMTERRMA